MTNEHEQLTFRILDVIQPEKLLIDEGCIPEEIAAFPLYEYVADGVIKPSSGIKRNQDTILFYDVSQASEQLKEKYLKSIMELEVRSTDIQQSPSIPSTLGEKTTTVLQLTKTYSTSIMELTGCYSDLTKSERAVLGRDFVTLEHTKGEIHLKPVIRLNEGYFKDMYLRVDPSLLNETLLVKISGELTELIQKSDGSYRLAQGETLDSEKKYTIS